MEWFQDVAFEKLTASDVAPLTVIMKKAFDEDARRHLGEAPASKEL